MHSIISATYKHIRKTKLNKNLILWLKFRDNKLHKVFTLSQTTHDDVFNSSTTSSDLHCMHCFQLLWKVCRSSCLTTNPINISSSTNSGLRLLQYFILNKTNPFLKLSSRSATSSHSMVMCVVHLLFMYCLIMSLEKSNKYTFLF